ncbi:MAG TPA: glycosyltransferase family 1 protein [Patescibacteria group bacterium]|nr:glycosyltransferase family 1 protein [Patescibacteria group bacterium]
MQIGVDIRPLMSPLRTGVAEYTFELLKALFAIDKTNHYYLYYNSYHKTYPCLPDFNGAKVDIMHTRFPNKLLNASLLCFNRPRLDKLIPYPLDAWFSPNLHFTALSKNIPQILTIHDLSFEFFPEFFTTKQRLINSRRAIKRANLILAPSFNTKRDIINFYKTNEAKVEVIYPGLSSEIFPTTPEQKTVVKNKFNLPERFLLFVGAYEPRKNLLCLLEAFEKVYNKETLPIHLVIAGAPGWKNEKIFEYIKNSGIREKIHCLGYVTTTEKTVLYELAELFVFPSHYEGFGFPVLEAMALGTPVITSNHSSLPEITGKSAYLINPLNPNDLSRAIQTLLNSKELRDWQQKNGHVAVKQFSWKKSAEQFLSALEKLTK